MCVIPLSLLVCGSFGLDITSNFFIMTDLVESGWILVAFEKFLGSGEASVKVHPWATRMKNPVHETTQEKPFMGEQGHEISSWSSYSLVYKSGEGELTVGTHNFHIKE